MDFIVCRSLAAPVTMGWEYWDRFLESIRLRLNQVEPEEGTVVPIVRQHVKPATIRQFSLPPAQVIQLATREYTKLRATSAIVVLPESQIMVSVNSCQNGLRIVQPLLALYDKYQSAITNGVVSLTPDHPFQLLVASLDKTPQRLAKHQIIGSVIPHPLPMLPT